MFSRLKIQIPFSVIGTIRDAKTAMKKTITRPLASPINPPKTRLTVPIIGRLKAFPKTLARIFKRIEQIKNTAIITKKLINLTMIGFINESVAEYAISVTFEAPAEILSEMVLEILFCVTPIAETGPCKNSGIPEKISLASLAGSIEDPEMALSIAE